MAIYKTYIQQTSFDGTSYTKGAVVDLLATYNIICQEMPFMVNPLAKDLPKRDWPDEDGQDVYVPATRRMKEYTMEVDFLYVGTDTNIRTDLKNFINFLYGRNTGAVGSLLAIYNAYTDIGRKDVIVQEVSNEVFIAGDSDPDAIAKIKVKFLVCDPITEVSFSSSTTNGTTTLTLTF